MILIEIGLLFALLGGVFFKLFPPKNINSIYGWRSRLSMRNKDTWAEAQKYGSNAFIVGGIILALIGVIIQFTLPKLVESIKIILVILGTSAIILAGEVHLRKIFNKDGSKK
ncbi:hypothetical protein D3C81_1287070 [compost metagenome]